MPRRRRSGRIPTPVWEPRRGVIGRFGRQLGARLYLLAALIALVLVAASVIALAFVRDYLEERGWPGAAALAVGDRTYSLDYLARRLASFSQGIVGVSPEQLLAIVAEQLVEEATVRHFAPELGVSVSPQEVEEELAQRLDLKRDDPGFAEAYQAEVTRSGLSDREYRQMVEAQLLARKVREKLGEAIPAQVEQVHYRRLLVGSEEEALGVIARLRGGEDFGALAQEVSLDTASKDKGGDAGWLARGANDLLEDVLFALEPGAISEPFSAGGSGFYVFQVLEKRTGPPDEEQKAQMQAQVYQRWLAEKQQTLQVVSYVTQDPEKQQWVLEHAFGS